MFDLKLAKEIIIKPNGDNTYTLSAKYDCHEEGKSEPVKEVEISYPKTKIEMNVNVLSIYDGYKVTLEDMSI